VAKKNIPKNQKTKPIKTDEESSFVRDLVSDVIQDEQARGVYLNKLENAWMQRMMFVNDDDIPWPGAPNFSMPFTDKLIRKRKPPLVASILNPKKMAIVSPEEGVPDPEKTIKGKADKAETLLNLFLRKKMNWTESLILGTDYMLEKGRTYFKVFEKFESKFVNRSVDIKSLESLLGKDVVDSIKDMEESQVVELISKNSGFNFDLESDAHVLIMQDIAKRFKSGEQEIDFQMEVIESGPMIQPIPPERLIIPPNSPRDVQKLSRFAHEFFLSERELTNAAESGQFDKDVVEAEIQAKNSLVENDKRSIEVQKDNKEGVAPQIQDDPNLFKIWEIHSYWKRKDSKRFEKYVTTVFANSNNGEFLRIMREPNDEDMFPLVAIDHEILDDRATSSRGIPEMIRFTQEIIDMQENNRMRRDIVKNTPFFTIRRQSGITSDSFQFSPGLGLAVENHDDLQIHNVTNSVDVNSERVEATAKQFGEEFIGSVNFAFSGSQNAGIGRGANTLGEVRIAQTESEKIATLDFVNFNAGITKLYTMVFQILRSSLTKPLEIDGTTITREDFNFPFEVRSNGNLEESDKAIGIQKTVSRMQVINSQDPTYTTLEDRYNAFLDYLEAEGVKDIEKLSTNPINVMKDQSFQLQQQVSQLQQQSQALSVQLQEGVRDLEKIKQDQVKQVIEKQVKRENPGIKERIITQVENTK